MKPADQVWMPTKSALVKATVESVHGPVTRVKVFDGYKYKTVDARTADLTPYAEGEPPTISRALQIKEIERELAMREAVYPKRVAANSMTQDKADYYIAAMRSVLETLKSIPQ